MKDLHKSTTLVWVLLAAFTIVWLYVLGIRTLVPPDEGRYAEMAREMWASGDWITTRLNGIKYFEKPPLQTWMNALTFTVFGLGEWQARLWTGLCGLLGVVLTGYAGKRVFSDRVGLYAGLVLGSSLFWVAAGQVNSLDMGLSGMMTIALCGLLVAQRDDASPAQRRNWMLVCWAGMALAVLAKGLIGVVLPGAVLVLYTLATRDWRLWGRLHLGQGLLLFFAIAAPWFVLVALKNPEQPHFFFIHEHWDRFLHDDHHRTGSWHYFVVPLLVGMTPWLGVLLQSLVAPLWPATGTAQPAQPAQPIPPARGRFQPRLMLLLWAGFIFFFFSYSSSKLPGYIVPIFPALALLVALFLERAGRVHLLLAAGAVALAGAAFLAVVYYLPRFVGRPEERAIVHAFQPWVLGAALVMLAGGLLALRWIRNGLQRDAAVLALALSGFASTQLILAGFEHFGQQRAGLAMVAPIQAALRPGSTVYSVDIYEQSLPFYLRRTVVLVNYLDEFTFGLEQQPTLSIPTVEQFITLWQAHAAAGQRDVALVSVDTYHNLLQRRDVPLFLVYQDNRRVVVANQPVNPPAANSPVQP